MWQGSPSPLVDLVIYLVHTHARLGCTSMGRLGFVVAVPPCSPTGLLRPARRAVFRGHTDV